MVSKKNLFDMDTYNVEYNVNVRKGIDMTDSDVRDSRLKINQMLARFGYEPKDRAEILEILGLAYDDEFRPEFRPEPPVRWCTKKAHNIGDPSKYRFRERLDGVTVDKVCLQCEAENKIRLSQPRPNMRKKGTDG